LYIADTHNQAIRSIDLGSATVSTLVGVAGQTGVRLGYLAEARLNFPSAIAALPEHSLVITDEVENSLLLLKSLPLSQP